MSECNRILKEQKVAYPRTCALCGMSGPCKKPLLNPDGFQYGAIVKDSYYAAGYDAGDPGYNVDYEKIKEFESEQSLKDWIKQDQTSTYGGKKLVAPILFKRLKAETKVEISLG